jgi:N-acetylmuramoyl-L-alanine amidase
MIFISAGHCNYQGPNFDPGAPGINNRWEATETAILRDAVIAAIREQGGGNIMRDLDSESLKQFLARLKTDKSSVVVEFHFNAGPPIATGTEVFVGDQANAANKSLAATFANTTASLLGIRNRGVKSEVVTRHKRLALMRKPGIVTLIETCFITNHRDMAAYDRNFKELVRQYAAILLEFDSSVK